PLSRKHRRAMTCHALPSRPSSCCQPVERSAGAAGARKLLLLHGFPSASHMFRDLIPRLASRFHIIAPDLPGFGKSDMPRRDQSELSNHTFDLIAATIDRFSEVAAFDRCAVYVFDRVLVVQFLPD